MQCFQFFYLLLEDSYVVHKGDHSVSRHWRSVEAGSCQERSYVEGHGALGSVEDKQLAPGQPQEGHLVCDLEVWEEGDIPGPLHRAEEHPSCQFTNVLDAHDVVGLHALTAKAGGGVGLCSQKKGDISG
ncbi:hypothetical protein N330_06150 [Leptosomus discolor]|uniref:Uncharacterized protein n=2 Tax=Telluraves TaxID=3073808 RepID=A0A091S737_NESNO|nr:hypothetical protein N330_06150 [Leptosomus discolor]KFQ52463.1 hypothetical protein N333_13567 [Nestor notabilis]KFQ78271.1 hypothetical protein N337_08357 [Phoenicopterus ruber ruber]